MADIVSMEEYEKMTVEEKIEDFLKQEEERTDDIDPLTEGLSKVLEDDELTHHTFSILRGIWDGEPANKNPLTEIPTSQMVLYKFYGGFKSESVYYFDTEEELKEHVKNNDGKFADICVLEFIGNFAGRSDVIRQTSKNRKPMLLSACDRDGYAIYNEERSTYCGEFVWEYNHGDIKDMYSAFRDRGIVFENDIYRKIEEEDREFEEELKKEIQKRKRIDSKLIDMDKK